MNKKMNVALLSGGKSGEREVSLNSGRQVADALDMEKYDVRHYDPAVDLNRLISDASDLDVALIILHGKYGEDGTIQGLLDLIDLPYLGSGVLSSSLCMDKRASKDIYRYHGLPVPKDVVLDGRDKVDIDHIIEKLSLPVVVKPACEGSSLGMSIPGTRDELEAGVREALACGRWVIVEEYIKGRELTSSIMGNDDLEALPLIEITPGDEFTFFNYEAKYVPGASREICPAPVNEDITRRAKEIGLAAHRALFCRGLSRTDMILKDDKLYVLETNTIPGMTSTSLFPQAAQAAGYTFGQTLDRLIELALEDAERGQGK
jgi:D-alanine-D-alanine ligase